ncbi:bifunctional isocitrate dehydrogenase kinase/phosphatase [Algicola sagamiensis]|uniref:bifunctional isocitrate dehydrogenase kinase/phosphatase n=1 Tax=Algicola sagamiensis TaxID=163869 RepID=UPI00037A2ABA|nr:bifunctional isocitrate dehydrogenase kinase/phosphatase [Algicola sagamiensis]
MTKISAEAISVIIQHGFQKHIQIIHEITEGAKKRFEQADWAGVQDANAKRISFYDERVKETILQLKDRLNTQHHDTLPLDPLRWMSVKKNYICYLEHHPQAELAETFFNSVFCHLFHRQYFNNDFIFVRTTLEYHLPVPENRIFTRTELANIGLKNAICDLLNRFEFTVPFEDLDRDIRRVIGAFQQHTPVSQHDLTALHIDTLNMAFYRNKAAYIVGRVVTPTGKQPFILPILNNEQTGLYVDALILDRNEMTCIFGYSRSYFFAKTETPSAVVRFLQELLPHKTLAELYSTIGFHKQGKTEFYREFLQQLAQSNDRFIRAPGIKGMVMEVFTLPSFPYVFKVIKDKFSPTKDFSRKTVKDRYFLVKKHDRVGRMADTLEYSEAAFPKDRFAPELLEALQETIPKSIEITDSLVVIKHLYIERRMIPLNIYLEYATDQEVEDAINDYGLALKEMIAANIFPGDMLLKNFGVTRHKRVVFYDYDEVQYLLDVNFRKIPEPRYPEDELADEPWYSIAPGDVFPEQITTFVTTVPKIRQLLLQYHPELMDACFWQQKQQNIREHIFEDIFPYPQNRRFRSEDEKSRDRR